MSNQPPLLARVAAFALRTPTSASGVHLQQEGTIRLAPDRPWMAFLATQDAEASRVAFRWTARVRMRSWLRATVTDAFDGTHGRLRARLFGLLPVADATGLDLDRGEVLRYLAELPWCPWAYRQNRELHWTQDDASTLRVRTTLTDPACEASFEIDDEGRVVSVTAERPREEESGSVERTWGATFEAWTEHGGIHYPERADVWWHLPEGRFPYWRGRVVDLEARPDNGRGAP